LHLLIAYFLSNISAKYYDNPTMLTRVIAKNVGMYFLRHSVCARTAPSFRHERSHHACFKHALKIWQSRSTLMVTARSTTIAIRSNCASTAFYTFPPRSTNECDRRLLWCDGGKCINSKNAIWYGNNWEVRRLETWHGVVIKAGKGWRVNGSTGQRSRSQRDITY